MGKLSKAKTLTEAEKYCIQGMYYNEMSLEEISKTLGREPSDVEPYVSQLNKEDNERRSASTKVRSPPYERHCVASIDIKPVEPKRGGQRPKVPKHQTQQQKAPRGGKRKETQR